MGISVGDLACHYVTGVVRGETGEQSSPAAVVALLAEMREDIAVSVQHLLASAGRVKAEDALKWTDENLRT